jgi:2-phosphosulfolactate phosphatase
LVRNQVKLISQSPTMTYDQSEFDVRCEWGEKGVEYLAPSSDAVVIVDVFSFSTSVDITASRGAIIYPYNRKKEDAAAYAASLGAELADLDGTQSRYSLFPQSLLDIPAGTRLVLPSLNGSVLTLLTGQVPTFAGCLRNAWAVADSAQKLGQRIAVIAAGERWQDGSLRPALEDWIGAGAIISGLQGSLSPEAESARAAYLSVQNTLAASLRQCSSGKELLERGRDASLLLATALNSSITAPRLINGAYQKTDA